MGSAVFRLRGLLMAPFGLLLLLWGQPSVGSFLLGLGVALLGEAIRIWGVGYAGESTRQALLKAPKLVTAGPFAHLRHPLYLGNALTGLGGTIMAVGHFDFRTSSLFFLAFVFFYGLVYGLLIPYEERFLEESFQEEFRRYKSSVPCLLPRLKAYPNSTGEFSWGTALFSEIHTLMPLLIVVIVMAFKIR